jgi:hypothetical protein
LAEASTRKFETSYKHFTFDLNPPSGPQARFWEVMSALDDPGSLDLEPDCAKISYARRYRKKEVSSGHRLRLYTSK